MYRNPSGSYTNVWRAPTVIEENDKCDQNSILGVVTNVVEPTRSSNPRIFHGSKYFQLPPPQPPHSRANKFQLNISNKSERGTVPSRVTVVDYFLDMKETTEKVRLTHHPLPLSPQSGNIVSLSGAPPPLLPTSTRGMSATLVIVMMTSLVIIRSIRRGWLMIQMKGGTWVNSTAGT